MATRPRSLGWFACGCERRVRAVIARTPAALVIAVAITSAWMLDRHLRSMETAPRMTSCLQVVASPAEGRLAWIAAGNHGKVDEGEIVARLEGHSPDEGLRSPVAGVIRAVIRQPGDTLRKGDPLLVVASPGDVACQ